jgi:diphthamide synthase (EF-2-diphthine--ammonia ligase)
MSWSSGKDSAMALDVARTEGTVEVTALLSTVNADADRVAMHAVRRSLLEAQADRLGLALVTVNIPSPCSNEIYPGTTENHRMIVFGALNQHR